MKAIAAILIVALLPLSAVAAPPHCPPGLAKKAPPCVPPGLARKQRGDDGWRIDERYRRLDAPRRYGLDPRWDYYLRDDGYVFRVDPETRAIIDLVDALDRLLD